MRTIKQELKLLISREDSLEYPKTRDYKDGLELGFIVGSEIAQRWISIEEELPPVLYKEILIKGNDFNGNEGIIDIGFMQDSCDSPENIVSLNERVFSITHWRPIEFK